MTRRRRRRRVLYEVEGGRRVPSGGSMAVRTSGGGLFAAVDRFFFRMGWATKRYRRRVRTVRRR